MFMSVWSRLHSYYYHLEWQRLDVSTIYPALSAILTVPSNTPRGKKGAWEQVKRVVSRDPALIVSSQEVTQISRVKSSGSLVTKVLRISASLRRKQKVAPNGRARGVLRVGSQGKRGVMGRNPK